jgi:hypothetical protein
MPLIYPWWMGNRKGSKAKILGEEKNTTGNTNRTTGTMNKEEPMVRNEERSDYMGVIISNLIQSGTWC